MASSSPSPFSATLSFANPSSMPRPRASTFSVLNTRAMSKDLYFNHDGSTTKKLLAGVDLVAELLGVTLGPKGRNVVLHNKYGPPKIVNDGETVLKEVLRLNPSDVTFGDGSVYTERNLILNGTSVSARWD
ncbi:rubisco large subunit-binding protein beta subunit [Trifolium pratense]|uniref:Rubisco large subunit-binding protein beta subunit n=1 Tax=Trifolium pratense TaxID=57577 RepID=A0A2K3LLJ4_TRIPR|nr:rubisco large subunit-binding protein beta subunit [Trifolium pratense]